jgi:hypothetical protein
MRPGGAHLRRAAVNRRLTEYDARGAETSRPTMLRSAGPASPSKVARPDQLTQPSPSRGGLWISSVALSASVAGPVVTSEEAGALLPEWLSRSACAIGGGFALSPDGSQLATDGQIVTLATSATVPLPTPFTPVAWLGSNDLIGTGFKQTADSPCGDETVGIVHLSQRPSLESWAFSGQVVGVVLP